MAKARAIVVLFPPEMTTLYYVTSLFMCKLVADLLSVLGAMSNRLPALLASLAAMTPFPYFGHYIAIAKKEQLNKK